MPALWQTVLYAIGGGFAIQFYYLWARNNMPANRRPDLNQMYWFVFACMPLVGGFLASAYEQSGNQLNPILAVHIGVSAPAILRSMARENPIQRPVDPPPGA
jgi:hypothetical protein